MTKSKPLASSTVLLSIFAIHLVNGVQFLNATWVKLCSIIVISPLAEM